MICHSRKSGNPWPEMSKKYHLYILASHPNGTLYIGVTSDLATRIFQHKQKTKSSFTSEYNVTRLVYCEEYADVNEAIQREKRMKKWRRAWKIELIERDNPEWRDLYFDLHR